MDVKAWNLGSSPSSPSHTSGWVSRGRGEVTSSSLASSSKKAAWRNGLCLAEREIGGTYMDLLLLQEDIHIVVR